MAGGSGKREGGGKGGRKTRAGERRGVRRRAEGARCQHTTPAQRSACCDAASPSNIWAAEHRRLIFRRYVAFSHCHTRTAYPASTAHNALKVSCCTHKAQRPQGHVCVCCRLTAQSAARHGKHRRRMVCRLQFSAGLCTQKTYFHLFISRAGSPGFQSSR
jgi:hypothetical protein